MPSEREQRVRAALNTLLSAQYEVSVADPLSLQLRPLALARNDAFEAVVAIACEPEAAPDAEEIEAWSKKFRNMEWLTAVNHPLTKQHVHDEAVTLMRRAQPATANELAIRELEVVRRFLVTSRASAVVVSAGNEWVIASLVDMDIAAVDKRLAALRQPAPAKEEAK